MNRMLKLFFLTLLIVFAALPMLAKSNSRANIRLNDGTVYENVEVKYDYGIVKIILDNSQIKAGNNTISEMVIWHKDNPDMKVLLKPMWQGRFDPDKNEYKTVGDRKYWFALQGAGENLSYWVKFKQLKVKKKGISFEVFPYQSPNYFLRNDDDVPYCIPNDGFRKGMMIKWLKAFLADDLELCERLSEKGYRKKYPTIVAGNTYINCFNYEDIAEDYNPSK